MYTPAQSMQLISYYLAHRCMADVKAATGISTATLHRWRNAEVQQPRLSTFLALASYFQISVQMPQSPALRLAA